MDQHEKLSIGKATIKWRRVGKSDKGSLSKKISKEYSQSLIKKRRRMLEAAHGLRKCSEDCGFHYDQKATRGSKCPAVTKKLTPSEVKFKQKISYFYAPIISKRSRLDSDVVVKADTVTLSNNHSNYGPSQRSSKNSPLQIDDEDLLHNRTK